ncbi:endonuclease/exonuclease/phosphatase (EEP) superfamily protein YafD [Neisseria sp. HSC-16F19]|nr:endonuclease/exonuclease/phosphatase family protein [Neisseria sp. HSC-16F19]MCP2040075.1 endonuclease/exonuclease/phosphatase (EEP) superfamily protein YafD [Neisseria sp. HSC-16F19]
MSRLHRFFHTRLNLLAAAALLAVLAGQLGSLWWPLELFSHFLPHYAALFALAALVCRGRSRMLWTLCTALALGWLMANSGNNSSRDKLAAAPVHTLIWHNVHLHHPDPAAAMAQFVQADMLVLAEMSADDRRWQDLAEHYPHGCAHADNGPFALALMSRAPLHTCQVQWIGDYPYIRAQLADGTAVYALHPPPPVNADLAAARQQYLAIAAQAIAADERVLVAGDLNSSPFSPLFRQFKADAALRPHNPYWLPTWQPLGLNIDHILSRNLGAVTVEALGFAGSDHRALRVQYSRITQNEARQQTSRECSEVP